MAKYFHQSAKRRRFEKFYSPFIFIIMKLTQATLFQCFDKSQRQSPIILDDKDPDIIECETELKLPESHPPPPDFLLPIHIRQEDKSLQNEIIPLLKQWKFTDSNDDLSSNYPQNFYRICPTTNQQPINSPKLQFIPIASHERQMELFQQYTNDDISSYAQSAINWQSIFHSLQDYRQKAIEQNQYDQLPWTEIYRPRTSKAYLGCHKKQVRRLNEWFSHWTKKLNNEQPKKSGRKRRRNYDDNSDDDFIDDSNMSYYNRKQEHPQMIYIHGCGTTSLVHALAEEHHFKVTEINGSQSRARASLIKQLEQVTSHHYLSLKRCASDTVILHEEKSKTSIVLPVRKKAKNERGTITSFFNKKKSDSKPTRRNKKEEEIIPTDIPLGSSVQVEKTSLILFDEIETLTIDDNFWSCLKKLLETAKKPIILTSNSRSHPDDAIFNLSKLGDYEMIHLESNEPELIYCFLRLILLVEMFEISSLDDLTQLCQSCSYDLRQSLLTLQFLAQTSSVSQSRTKDKSLHHPTLFPSSQIFDTISYSYLREQWDQSILKTLFDDLTMKYTSEYDQSPKQTEKDSKRMELFDTLKMFMQEQEIDTLTNRSAFHLDYRPYIRQICQNEQIRASDSFSTRRLRHSLTFRGCSLQWPDFAILSHGLD